MASRLNPDTAGFRKGTGRRLFRGGKREARV